MHHMAKVKCMNISYTNIPDEQYIPFINAPTVHVRITTKTYMHYGLLYCAVQSL